MDNSNTDRSIQSLEDLCEVAISRSVQFNSVSHILKFYTFFDNLAEPGSVVNSYIRLYNIARSKVRSFFPSLLSKFGQDYLEDILRKEDFDLFIADVHERENIEKRFSYLRGRDVERCSVHEKVVDDDMTPTADSVTGEQAEVVYPLNILLQGRAWPTGVDPTRRQDYLSDNDFVSVFKISKSQFSALDKYKRTALKKEVGLF